MPLKADRRPQILGSFHKATTDERQIRKWWGKWPNAGVAIATGSKSGVCVVDVDPRNGGNDTLARLSANPVHSHLIHRLSTTLQVETGGGGTHFYVDLKDPYIADHYEIRSGNDRLGSGIDVKSEGGYVVAPPTIHNKSGRGYHWVNYKIAPVSISAKEAHFLGHKPAFNENDTQEKCTEREMIHRRNISPVYQSSYLYPEKAFLSKSEKVELYRQPEAQQLMLDHLGFKNYANLFENGRALVLSTLYEDNHPSAGLLQSETGDILFKDFRIDASSFTLPQLFATQSTGSGTRLSKSEYAVWSMRLAIQSGVVPPAHVTLPALPESATKSVRVFYQGVELLFATRWKDKEWAYRPVAMSRKFMANWCGIGEASVERGKRYLLKHGVIRSTREHYGPYQAWTFLPGEGKKND
ncbi:MAG: bifunctional DNA primase/polymerase [Candidatus Thiodiazotropha sp. (ex Codakia orbicularis)]|nr:bifunctional DNA primase/polymerase [Candidatus Thiodiazotropha sp. (ex Codakia orbicularis)]